ncbi:MAG: oxidoreductase [Verrucomicrobia bacterium]|nr:oxidoreductase [Verrucomicrobiota bacterium]
MSERPSSIPVALIGYGYAGKTFHAPLINAVPGLELILVASRDPKKVLANLPGTQVLADPAAVATHPDAELVVIASPNDTHAPLAELALQAGKHVVVDKPFTLSLDEARRLAGLAGARERLLSVFQNRRWDSDFLGLKAVIASGQLGEVLSFESRFDRYRPEVRMRWREQAGPGSGLWYDLGPHLVDQALQLFGLPTAVTAHLVAQRPSAQTVDWAHAVLGYGRLQVVLHASMLVAGGVPRFAVHGTAGSWVKFGLDVQEDSLRAGRPPGGPGWGEDPVRGLYYEGANGKTSELAAPPGDYRQYYAQIRDAILGTGSSPVAPAQAVAVMAVLETALRSAAEGRTLPLPLTESERRLWQ